MSNVDQERMKAWLNITIIAASLVAISSLIKLGISAEQLTHLCQIEETYQTYFGSEATVATKYNGKLQARVVLTNPDNIPDTFKLSLRDGDDFSIKDIVLYKENFDNEDANHASYQFAITDAPLNILLLQHTKIMTNRKD